jgi:ankyrin repeat protein
MPARYAAALTWAALSALLRFYGPDTPLRLGLWQDVSLANAEGNTPLHWAACNGQCDAMRLLLMHGASASALNRRARVRSALRLDAQLLPVPEGSWWVRRSGSRHRTPGWTRATCLCCY